MGARLSREAVFKADDIRTEEVSCPEWADPQTGADTVLVRGLTGAQRDIWEASVNEQQGSKTVPNYVNATAKLVVLCCVNEDGTLMFEPGDADLLGSKSGAPVNRIFRVAARLSGMRDEDIAEMTENFGAAPGGSSSSSSPNGAAPPSQDSSLTPTAAS